MRRNRPKERLREIFEDVLVATKRWTAVYRAVRSMQEDVEMGKARRARLRVLWWRVLPKLLTVAVMLNLFRKVRHVDKAAEDMWESLQAALYVIQVLDGENLGTARSSGTARSGSQRCTPKGKQPSRRRIGAATVK